MSAEERSQHAFFEIRIIGKVCAERFETPASILLHELVEDIAGMECCNGVIAKAEVVKIGNDRRAIGGKTSLNEPHRQLVIIDE